MNKTINLTDWFWSEVKKIEKKKYDRSQEREITSYSIGREICQCATETFIENSRNPGKMRSIMMICFLIDMLMRRKKYSAGKSGQKIYAKFNNTFRYPIIVAHPMGEEFPSPSWFVGEHTLFWLETSSGNMWKGFEDKVTHPQYNGDVKNGTRIVKEL